MTQKPMTQDTNSNATAYSPFKHEPYQPLGVGLRLVELYFLILLIVTLAVAAVTNPSNFDYDLSLLYVLYLCGTCLVSLWSIQVRSSHARAIAGTCLIVCNVLMVADMYIGGSFAEMAASVGTTMTNIISFITLAWGIAAFIYLVFSPKAKQVLSREYDYDDAPGGHTWELPLGKRLRSWAFWRDLGIYFITFSFLGHWAEMAFCQLIRLGIVMGDYDPSNHMLWDQWMYPFSAEGIALVLIVLILFPFSRWILKKMNGHILPAVIISFFANALVCTSIDFTTGISCNLDYHLWDYRQMPFNFMGQICLQNSLVYSSAATLIVWVIYPLMDKGLRKVPKIVLDGVFWFLVGVYGFCALLHFMFYLPTGFVFG